MIRVKRTGKNRNISIVDEIEPAYREIVNKGDITRSQIEDLFSKRNPAYVAAILANLSGVRFDEDPIRIIWLGKKYD